MWVEIFFEFHLPHIRMNRHAVKLKLLISGWKGKREVKSKRNPEQMSNFESVLPKRDSDRCWHLEFVSEIITNHKTNQQICEKIQL